jgi:hypothetical protein
MGEAKLDSFSPLGRLFVSLYFPCLDGGMQNNTFLRA